jgi:hypothetical protein
MASGMIVKLAALDDDYFGFEIYASIDRFAGSAHIYAGLQELSEFATCIAGFPSNPEDERVYEFGSRAPSIADMLGYGFTVSTVPAMRWSRSASKTTADTEGRWRI